MFVLFIYCTARQCWPIGEFRLVPNNQSSFGGNRTFSLLFIGQFSFSLLFIDHYLVSTIIGTVQNGPNDRIGPNYRIGPDCAGRA